MQKPLQNGYPSQINPDLYASRVAQGQTEMSMDMNGLGQEHSMENMKQQQQLQYQVQKSSQEKQRLEERRLEHQEFMDRLRRGEQYRLEQQQRLEQQGTYGFESTQVEPTMTPKQS